MRNEVLAYLKSDRQWSRDCRIGHARYERDVAAKQKRTRDQEFWQFVLDANGAVDVTT